MSSWIRLINLSKNYHRFRKILLYQDAEGPAQDYVMDPARVDVLAAPDVPDAVIRVVALALDRVPWIARRHVVAVPVIVQDVPVLAVLYVRDVPVALDVVPLVVQAAVVALEDVLDHAEAAVLDARVAPDLVVPVAADHAVGMGAVQVVQDAAADAEDLVVALDAMLPVQGHAMDVQDVQQRVVEHVQ